VHFLAHATSPENSPGIRALAAAARRRRRARNSLTVSNAGSVVLRSAVWLALGGWVGSWALFAFVIARLAFRVLPSAEIAGQLIGPTLEILHWYGALAGAALAALAWVLRRGRLLFVLPLVLAVACLVSQLGVTPQMEELRDLAFGPAGNVEATARYRHLHGISMAIFSAVLLGVIGLVVLHVRSESPRTRVSA
jgi:hypothetical protein